MNFPDTNKIKKVTEEGTLENAKVLEELTKKVDWKIFLKVWLILLGCICLTLFSIIVSIKLALMI